MIGFVPSWMTWEVEQALARITGRWVAKKRATVLRLAEGVVIGRSMASTFEMVDTCSETTWYGRYKDGVRRKGWKDDVAIVEALEMAIRRALQWEDEQIGRGIEAARRRLASEAEPAIERLAQLRDEAQKEDLRFEAARYLYERADALPLTQMAEKMMAGEGDFPAQKNDG